MNKISDEVVAIFEKHGVENWAVIYNDPDSDTVRSRGHGSIVWRMGALFAQLVNNTEDWLKAGNDEKTTGEKE